jgi:hypothetical protein
MININDIITNDLVEQVFQQHRLRLAREGNPSNYNTHGDASIRTVLRDYQSVLVSGGRAMPSSPAIPDGIYNALIARMQKDGLLSTSPISTGEQSE